MPQIEIDSARLHYEVAGDGPPLVLVHGSWTDASSWDALVPLLAESFQVVRYDRRGHTRSERPAALPTRRDHENDLAHVIETLAGGAAHVVGNSYGGLVTLGLAVRRPELVRSASVHEPPAVTAAPAAESVRRAVALFATIAEEIRGGAVEAGTRRFMEEAALGPGAWAMLPEGARSGYVANAPTFVAEQSDPRWARLDWDAVNGFEQPLQLTKGDASPLWLRDIADALADTLPAAEVTTLAGAGHAPHLTHPEEYAEVVAGVVRESAFAP